MTTNVVSILGEGHSGSTLLDLILGSHSKVVSVGEVTLLEDYRRDHDECTCGELLDSCPFWAPILDRLDDYLATGPVGEATTDTRGQTVHGGVARARYRLGILATLLLPVQRAPWVLRAIAPDMHGRGRLVLRLYDLIRETSGRPVVVDSSKGVNRFRLLDSLKPKRNKAIFLTRDGRAYVAGNLSRSQLDPDASSREWRFTNTYTRRMLKRAPRSSCLHVRYEELCLNPEATIRRICTFVGLDFEPEMLNFRGQEAHNIGGNRMRLDGAEDIIEDVKWRDALSREQRSVFDDIGGELNRELLGELYVP